MTDGQSVTDGQQAALRFEPYLAGMDVMMWAVNAHPRLKLGIVSVWLLDRPVTPAAFRAAVAGAVAAGPRLRQVITRAPFSTAPPRFVDDQNFDLAYHTPVVEAPGRGDLADLIAVAERIGAAGYDYRRPLWEFSLVTGLQGGGCAIVQKVHHVLTDGVGGLAFLIGPLLALSRTGSRTPGPAGPPYLAAVPSAAALLADAQLNEARTVLSAAGTLARAAGALAGDPAGAVRSAVGGTASLVQYLWPAGGPLSPVMTGRSRSVQFATLTAAVSGLKAASHAAGGTLNDGLVAAVAGGLARYHDQHEHPVRVLRMYMPVSLRGSQQPGRAGNEFSQAIIDVPVHLTDPAERIRRIRELSAAARRDPALRLFRPVAGLAGRLPGQLIAPLFVRRLADTDFVVSNVPGPAVPLYLCGAKVTGLFAFGPLGAGALNITAVSYHGRCYVGVATDPAAVPDPGVLLECLRAGLAEVSALAEDRQLAPGRGIDAARPSVRRSGDLVP